MKILIIGPLEKPITGVTVSNDLLYSVLQKMNFKVDCINTSLPFFQESVGRFSLRKVLYNLSMYLNIYKVFNSSILYITPGQSFFGVVKYLPYICMGALFRKEVIFHLHGNAILDTYLKLKGLKKRIYKYTIRTCTKGIVLSNSLKQNLEPFIEKSNIYVVSNFVESNYILSEQEILNKDVNKLNIIYLSNLMTEKGVFVFLNVLKKLKNNKVDFQCKIAGNIDEVISRNVLSLIDTLDHVEYLGVVKGDKKRELLKWGTVFVFPSIQLEGLPISVLEGLASGNHVISTKHDALLDLFNDNEIDFVDKGHVEDVYRLIVKKGRNVMKMKSNQNMIKTKFSEQKFVDDVIRVLEAQ